jgi:hypothetical protein
MFVNCSGELNCAICEVNSVLSMGFKGFCARSCVVNNCRKSSLPSSFFGATAALLPDDE